MRAYGFCGDNYDQSRGGRIFINLYSDESIWLNLKQARALLASLKKAIKKAEGVEKQ